MSHIHDIIDKDRHFVIDPVTRIISNESEKVVISQYDHDSERYTFEIPRFIEEHDMSLCDRVEVHFTNITRNKKQRNDDVYIVAEELENDRDTVYFSWLVSSNATQLIGSLKFSIVFLCFDDEGNTTYEWGTDIFESIQVIERLKNTATVLATDPDMLVQLKKEILASIPPCEGMTTAEVEQIVADYLKQYPVPEDGVDGKDGVDGADGADGYSPTVNIEAIEGGYRVTITDVNGSQSFDILNGTIGADGKDGEDGYTPVKGVDYYTEAEKEETTQTILDRLLGGTELKDMMSAMFSQFISIGSTEPENGPALWFDTTPSEVSLADGEILLVLGGDSDESDVLAEVNGSEYPVMNTDSPVVLDENIYSIEINN